MIKQRIVQLMSLAIAVSMTGPLMAQTQTRGQNEHGSEQRRDQMFSRLDANGDGTLNISEFSAVATRGFDRQDTNGDGTITRDELAEQRFTRRDRDGNGLLSADELRPVRDQNRGGEARERMRNMSPEQRQQMREQSQSRRHSPDRSQGAMSRGAVTDSNGQRADAQSR